MQSGYPFREGDLHGPCPQPPVSKVGPCSIAETNRTAASSIFLWFRWSLRMRPSPSIVPGIDPDNLVFEDYGRAGRAWAETDEDHTSLDAVTSDLLTGHYSRPLRVISFNTAEGWSRDVSEDVAHELRRRAVEQDRELPASVEPFVERYEGAIAEG